MNKTLLLTCLVVGYTSSLYAQSLDLIGDSELLIQQNTAETVITETINYNYSTNDSSWVLNSQSKFAHDSTNPLIQMPNIVVSIGIANPFDNIQYTTEGRTPNEIFRFSGDGTTYNTVTRTYYNASGTIDSTMNVMLQPDGISETVLNKQVFQYGSDYTVRTNFNNNNNMLMVSSIDSTITVGPDSTISASFSADGVLAAAGATITSTQTTGNTRTTRTYRAILPTGAVFNSAGPFTFFTQEIVTTFDLTTGSSESRTFTRTAQNALDNVPYTTQQYTVNTRSTPGAWTSTNLNYIINLATGDSTLVNAVLNTEEDFGFASRRYSNYGSENQFMDAESLTFTQQGATQDSTFLAFYNPAGNIIVGSASRRIRAASYPSTVAGFNVPAVPTSIDTNAGFTPEAISLSQNFPNPFNPTTTIGFNLAQNEVVRLAVYDVLGREVAVLINQLMPEGAHQVSFDASTLSSGHYLYRISTPSATLTRSMTLIK